MMDVSSQDSSLLVMDLSKGFSAPPLIPRHAEAKKPEWYHRRPPGSEISSSYRSRPSSSYNSLDPGPPVLCRDMDQSPDSLGNYMNATLTPRLDLYRVEGTGRVGVHGSLWHPGFYGPDQTGGPGPESSGGEESDSGSDVIFLVSSSKEPLLCNPFVQDGVGHIVAPLSPTVSSPDVGRGCYHRPQPLSSPSPDSSYSDESSESSVDIPVHHTRPVVLLSDLSAAFRNPPESVDGVSSEDSEVSVSDGKKKTSLCKKTKTKKAQKREVRRSSRVTRSSTELSASPCSASRSVLSRRAKNDAVGIYNESGDSDDLMDYVARMSSSDADELLSEPNKLQRLSSNSDESDMDTQADRKSVQRETPPRHRVSKSISRKQKTQKHNAHKTEKITRAEKNQQSRIKPESQNNKSAVKKKPPARRKKKRCSKTGGSAQFPPTEPEIRLRHVNINKEKKKEKKSGPFCPFVHMEHMRCTVINCQREEEKIRSREEGPQQNGTRSLIGFIPKSSCFQPGRSGLESPAQTMLKCCLCGHTANTMSLGDLHGPYIPSSLSVDCQHQDTDQNRARGSEQKEGSCGLINGSSEKSSSDGLPCSAAKTLNSHVSPQMDECWIHEDCGIWSAGLFLVQGKLYGLQEAARHAQRTVCSACRLTGAIIGCFQKGCQSNYHYRCAIQSGCVLNEENFSVLCPEHKNRLFSLVTRRRRR
ncbi:transcription factor 20-like isoform X1 [Labrus mixtus]|uniref:transcription factor 20-like isoform X1 n=2 Tax=Labrus mixtus TaxID=508554 RepID=UPI0029BFFAD9|nr:transcription factor 20-like isoform X1 [Labrus mixtus]